MASVRRRCRTRRALAGIPAAAAVGVLRFDHLLIVALLVGGLPVFFDAAYQAFVPVLVSRGRLVEANRKIETGVALSEITAPRVAGVLVQTFPADGGPGRCTDVCLVGADAGLHSNA
jgi:hypothetical protein